MQVYNRELKTLLDHRRDDVEPMAEMGERKGQERGSGRKTRVKLEDLTRFTMVKRIW
jgi:hypothetical protein